MARRNGPSALNALIAVNKPAGMTSHDVVSVVRRAVGEKRVGHAGTLDPAATGVLIIGIGMATKLLGQLMLDRKGYVATFQLGSETATDDAEGEVVRSAEVPASLFEDSGIRTLQQEVRSFMGEQEQVPPAYSAVSVGGKRAYAMARAGEEVELQPRRVTVYSAALTGCSPFYGTIDVELDVSKGTYVRSIARDLGRKLGCYAHVCSLVRTFAGPVTLDMCVDLDELKERGAELVHEKCLDPAWALGLATRRLEPAEIADVMNGRALELGRVRDGLVLRDVNRGERVALVWGEGLVGVWSRHAGELRCESNFPQAIEGICSSCDLGSIGPDAPLAARSSRSVVLSAVGGLKSWSGWSRDFELLDGLVHVEFDAENRLDSASFGPAVVNKSKAVVAIGAFDGFHRGHQALIARSRAEADVRGAALIVVTFDPDPAYVLGDPTASNDLLNAREREFPLHRAGVDGVLVVRFTPEVAALGYERFVREVLEAFVDLSCVCVGADFRFGAGGAGTVEALKGLGREDGFDVCGVELAGEDGSPITATRIRGLLRTGKVDDAAELLGRCHRVFGTVVHGRGEGAGFGFPTANVEVLEHCLVPAEGVYAGFVVVDHSVDSEPWNARKVAYPAAINVGRPRSDAALEINSDHGQSVGFLEATLLGFEGDLYGQGVHAVFVRWLREPRVFPSLAELESTVLSNVQWVRSTLGDQGIDLGRIG